jgi:hypothetical protein
VKVVSIDNSEDVGQFCTLVACLSLYLLASGIRVADVGYVLDHLVGLLLQNENVFLCDVFFASVGRSWLFVLLPHCRS